ncbi:MAG: DNA polymerase III subunit gamma/tau [Alphaproteobacteria bacterium]|nr:DNA polymerase III subunit gamma/tau [Alphaproteobacteria bacterium]
MFPATGTAATLIAAEAAPHYRVLARKYRPSSFAELIGQETVVQTLTNAIKAGRLAQAWMLTGVRGIGKTTTARIIARALNCTGAGADAGPTAEPCGVCENCKSIAADRHPDVLEMDAASRTGVDDIRDIIDGVRYSPTAARYKIYIIDEVHMLSKNAFNALLKTLEEPPPHVKFIFATTEIRKVPVTVLSRCQRFDLRRVESHELARHFADVSAREGVQAEEEAILLIARAADGSVRDGLSLLDQAIARDGKQITARDVRDMLGFADRAQVMDLCRKVLLGEMQGALTIFDDMIRAGADALSLLHDLCDLVHTLTRAKLSPDMLQGPELPEHERKLVQELSALEIPALTRAWQILLKGIGEVQMADNPAKAAAMLLVRLAYAASLPTPADLMRQMRSQPGDDAGAGPGAPGGGPPGGATARYAAPMRRGSAAVAVAYSNPEPVAAAQAEAAAGPALASMPETFRALVALFEEKREARLYSQLYASVQLVRFAPGKLDICAGPGVAANFASQVGQCLQDWTGQRWLVSVAREGGAPSLAEQDRQAAEARLEGVRSHPLVQKALAVFPGAKLANVRFGKANKNDVAIDGVPGDDAPVTDGEEQGDA